MRRVLFNSPNFDNNIPFATSLEVDSKEVLSNLCHVLDTRRNFIKDLDDVSVFPMGADGTSVGPAFNIFLSPSRPNGERDRAANVADPHNVNNNSQNTKNNTTGASSLHCDDTAANVFESVGRRKRNDMNASEQLLNAMVRQPSTHTAARDPSSPLQTTPPRSKEKGASHGSFYHGDSHSDGDGRVNDEASCGAEFEDGFEDGFEGISRGTSCCGAATDCASQTFNGEEGVCGQDANAHGIASNGSNEYSHASNTRAEQVGHRQHADRRARRHHRRRKMNQNHHSAPSLTYLANCNLQAFVAGMEYHLDVPTMSLMSVARRVDNVTAAMDRIAESGALRHLKAKKMHGMVASASSSAAAPEENATPPLKQHGGSNTMAPSLAAGDIAENLGGASISQQEAVGETPQLTSISSHNYSPQQQSASSPSLFPTASTADVLQQASACVHSANSPLGKASRALRTAGESFVDLTKYATQTVAAGVSNVAVPLFASSTLHDSEIHAEGTVTGAGCVDVSEDTKAGAAGQACVRQGSKGDSAPNVSEQQAATVGEADQSFPLPPMLELSAALECWACLFIWFRKAAIQMLRTLARAYSEHQWCLKYWLWAEKHPYQLEMHHLASLQFTTLFPIFVHRQSQAKYNVGVLSREDDMLISSIGIIHSALMRMNDALNALAYSIVQAGGGSRSGGEGGGDITSPMSTSVLSPMEAMPEVVTRGWGGFASTFSSVPPQTAASPLPPREKLSPFDIEEACSAYQYDEMVLYSIAVRFMKALQLASACMPAEGEEEQHREGSNNADRKQTDTNSSDSFTLEGPSTPFLKFCWSAILKDLSVATRRCDAFVKTHQSQLKKAVYPPVGRNWIRVTALSCLMLPVTLKIFHKLRSEAFPANFQKMGDAIMAYVQTWVWFPTRELIKSLTHVRPDAAQQRKYFEAEQDVTAKMLSDFIREKRPVTATELIAIEKAAREGDLSSIHSEHIEAVRRPIYSFFFGPLVRLMLIQLQQQRMAVTGVVISSDEVLESNDFNFKVMALSPVVLGVWIAISAFAKYRSKKKQPIYNRLKVCWRDLCRLVERSDGIGGGDYFADGLSAVSSTNFRRGFMISTPPPASSPFSTSGRYDSKYNSIATTPMLGPTSTGFNHHRTAAMGNRSTSRSLNHSSTTAPFDHHRAVSDLTPNIGVLASNNTGGLAFLNSSALSGSSQQRCHTRVMSTMHLDGRRSSGDDDGEYGDGGVRQGGAASANSRLPHHSARGATATARSSRGAYDNGSMLSSARDDLTPVEQGRVLLIIHEMRGLCEQIPSYSLLPQLLEDLADVEAGANNSRARRLRCLNRMLQTHPILHPTFMPMLK